MLIREYSCYGRGLSVCPTSFNSKSGVPRQTSIFDYPERPIRRFISPRLLSNFRAFPMTFRPFKRWNVSLKPHLGISVSIRVGTFARN